LAENGVNLYFKTTVGDNEARIVEVLDRALDRADCVLTSGGLGPTEDDLTREAIAALLGRPLEYRQALYDQLAARFARIRRPISENNKKQAFAPRGAIALENPHGTAPGLIIDDARGVIACMPGVPGELYPMLEDQIVPWLRTRFGLEGVLHSRVLKVCGVGESRIDAVIGDLIRSSSNPTVGVLASPDVVRIRITARAAGHAAAQAAAQALIAPVEAEVHKRLPGLIMGVDDETLEGVVDGLLAARGWTLAVGECRTGGVACQRLMTAGAQSFAGGQVRPEGAFAGQAAAQTGAAFAEDLRNQTGATCALAIVPGDAPEGTHVAFVTPEGTHTWAYAFGGTAPIQQVRAATIALEYVRRTLCGITPPESMV